MEAFRKSLEGSVLTSSETTPEEWVKATQMWNTDFKRNPLMIVSVASVDDVRKTVEYCVANILPFTVAAGRHSPLGLQDGAVAIDLGRLNSVEVDPQARLARVGAGVKLGALDAATAAHQLAVPAGHNPDTGVAGLTLGGGMGHLSRLHGLTCDNLEEAEVVLADGRVVAARADNEHADLLWALQGGSGNFGVVTRFTFRLHPVHAAYAGELVYPFDRVREVLDAFLEVAPTLSPKIGLIAAFVHGPCGPAFLVHAGYIFTDAGETDEEAQAAMADLICLAGVSPVVNTLRRMPYTAFQAAMADKQLSGQYYEKGGLCKEISPRLRNVLIEKFPSLPTPAGMVALLLCGGQMAASPPDATAFVSRDVQYWLLSIGCFTDENRDATLAWYREFGQAIDTEVNSQYVNTIVERANRKAELMWGPNLPRLQAVKRKYDPHNLFCRCVPLPL